MAKMKSPKTPSQSRVSKPVIEGKIKTGVGVKSEPQTFQHHVQELRRRISWVVLAVGVSGVLGYYFRLPIIGVLQHPLKEPLFYSSPAGSFNFVIKVASIIGIFVALPVLVYQILRFIEPALPKRIKTSTMTKLIISSFGLASLGVAFGFFIMIPTSLDFFSGFANNQIKPLISAMEYLNFVLNTLITFAVIFQIPLFVLFVNSIKPTKPTTLLHYQKHVIVGAFVLALLLPFTYDPVSQFVMAVPIIFLFYLSVLLLWINQSRNKPARVFEPLVKVAPLLIPRPEPTPSLVQTSPRFVQARSIDGFVITKRPLKVTSSAEVRPSTVAILDLRKAPTSQSQIISANSSFSSLDVAKATSPSDKPLSALVYLPLERGILRKSSLPKRLPFPTFQTKSHRPRLSIDGISPLLRAS